MSERPDFVQLLAAHREPSYLHPVCSCGVHLTAAEIVGATLTWQWREHVADVINVALDTSGVA